MTRVLSLVILIVVALAAPLAVEAQPVGKIPRMGFLGPSANSTGGHLVRAFQQGLRDLGYREGQNILIEYRSTEGDDERLARAAAELVGLNVDLLIVSITSAALAAQKATTTIPIVMTNVGDPVENGPVASLARPGGNITGLSRLTPELVGKNLEFIREAVPGVGRVAVLSNPTNPLSPALQRRVMLAAEALGVQLRIVEASAPHELGAAFAAMARDGSGAVLVLPDGMFFINRRQLAEFALKNRLPSMFANAEHAEAGGLMSYAPSSVDNYRRAAGYVDRILKGAKPADLPVEQRTSSSS
jgi:putative ABC transport system substrate-binding protein